MRLCMFRILQNSCSADIAVGYSGLICAFYCELYQTGLHQAITHIRSFPLSVKVAFTLTFPWFSSVCVWDRRILWNNFSIFYFILLLFQRNGRRKLKLGATGSLRVKNMDRTRRNDPGADRRLRRICLDWRAPSENWTSTRIYKIKLKLQLYSYSTCDIW